MSAQDVIEMEIARLNPESAATLKAHGWNGQSDPLAFAAAAGRAARLIYEANKTGATKMTTEEEIDDLRRSIWQRDREDSLARQGIADNEAHRIEIIAKIAELEARLAAEAAEREAKRLPRPDETTRALIAAAIRWYEVRFPMDVSELDRAVESYRSAHPEPAKGGA